jgi:hypothetical protein
MHNNKLTGTYFESVMGVQLIVLITIRKYGRVSEAIVAVLPPQVSVFFAGFLGHNPNQPITPALEM